MISCDVDAVGRLMCMAGRLILLQLLLSVLSLQRIWIRQGEFIGVINANVTIVINVLLRCEEER